jgi:hypothetical protein
MSGWIVVQTNSGAGKSETRMVTPVIGIADVPQAWWPLPGFVRMVHFAEAIRDVLAEADRLAGAARNRYPVAD